MKHLKQPVAWRANREDECTGHFFEGRFYSGALLSEQAVLAAMSYVDLNPVRAKICEAIDGYAHTSAYRRLQHLENSPERLQKLMRPLVSGISNPLATKPQFARISHVYNHEEPSYNMQTRYQEQSRNMPPISPTLWKEPKQARSRERVETIIQIAQQLIGEHGLEGFTMQDVAQLSGIPIGSLYQFFPDRNALVAKLFSGLLDEVDHHIEQVLVEVRTVTELQTATEGLSQAIYKIAKKKKAYVEIWHSLQALPTIRHMDEENSRKNAGILFTILRPMTKPIVSNERINTACFLVASSLSAAVQLALKLPSREGRAIIREFDAMSKTYIQSLLSD